jgi:NAD(P)-dependent dehydrogenase (short-subunit alcohol dehydrogenase family)
LGEGGILIKSPATARFWSGEDRRMTEIGESITRHTPMGRPGECEEIAEVAVFLAPSGASYINGADILVDGGIRATTFSRCGRA